MGDPAITAADGRKPRDHQYEEATRRMSTESEQWTDKAPGKALLGFGGKEASQAPTRRLETRRR